MGFRVLRAVMFLLFLLSAAVQLNDPDPLRWTLLYLLAAASCIVDRPNNPWLQRTQVILLVILVAIAIAGVLLLGSDLVRAFDQLSIGETVSMSTLGEERGREAGGLLIVGIWSATLLVRTVRTVRTVRPARTSGMPKHVTLSPPLNKETVDD